MDNIHLVGPKVENTSEGGITVASVFVPVVPKVVESLKSELATVKMVLAVMISLVLNFSRTRTGITDPYF